EKSAGPASKLKSLAASSVIKAIADELLFLNVLISVLLSCNYSLIPAIANLSSKLLELKDFEHSGKWVWKKYDKAKAILLN
ncbi:MAG TPA: hypothetical protein VLH77_06515, partial [Gammaproteobacteria bacterium]|nr:hypothetical protein [Gammaproteobacteria bacterium]